MSFSRQEQHDSALASQKSHAGFGELIEDAIRSHSEQTSQLRGLYEEVDKLTKAKSIVPTSDLLVDLVNGLIGDAKGLIHRDTYLDRLKMFVAAGNNPQYPDLLVALRVLQQSHCRFESMMKTESEKHALIGLELNTILAALTVAQRDEENGNQTEASPLDEEEEEVDSTDDDEDPEETDEEEGQDDEEAEADPEYEEYVRKFEVKQGLHGGAVSERWFERAYDSEFLFNFGMLDRLGVPEYVPPAAGITFVKTEK